MLKSHQVDKRFTHIEVVWATIKSPISPERLADKCRGGNKHFLYCR